MMNSGRAFTVTMTLSALGCALFACGAPASGEPVPGTTSQSISCMSDGIHIDTTCVGSSGGGLTPPPPSPAPTAQTCSTTGPTCSNQGTNAAGDYDPVVVENSSGDYVPDTAFVPLLTAAGCGVEHSFDGDAARWAMAVCPSSVSASVTSFGQAHGGVAGVIGCNPCTPTPLSNQVIVGWMIGTSSNTSSCPTNDGGVGAGNPPCAKPGPGCKSVVCME